MLRRVLVTGAGSGFGLATAVHLAGLGFAVTGLVPTGEERETHCERPTGAASKWT